VDAYKVFLSKHSLAEIGLDEDFVRSVRETGPGREVSL
jgi:hypothetical protein